MISVPATFCGEKIYFKGCEYYRGDDKTSCNPRPFVKFIHKRRIEDQYTMPRTLEHNAIVERRNYTIFDTVCVHVE